MKNTIKCLESSLQFEEINQNFNFTELSQSNLKFRRETSIDVNRPEGVRVFLISAFLCLVEGEGVLVFYLSCSISYSEQTEKVR